MLAGPKKIALLLFARSACADTRKKTLLPSQQKAKQLVGILNRRARKLAKASGLVYFVVDETLQKGPDFANRFHGAFKQVFALGFDQVIAIGNDCPALSVKLINRAQTELQSSEMVLGPCFDGGIYLLGLSRSRFEEMDFLALPWQTDRLIESLQTLQTEGNYRPALPFLHDIDTFQDLRRLFLLRFIPDWFFQVLKSLLFHSFNSSPFYVCLKTVDKSRGIRLRAPPGLC